MKRDVRVLFVTWDGPQSTYLEGLFLPIFKALRSRGFIFHVLQFTWSDEFERQRMQAACEASGAEYRSVTIWRQPLAAGSFATAVAGRWHVRRAILDLGINLLMPRSTMPALATIPAAGQLPVLLDADGLPHDERVEFQGESSKSLTYRILRELESWSLRRADAVTVRTRKAAQILSDRAGIRVDRIHVISNARDSDLFAPGTSRERGDTKAELGMREGEPLLIYVGSSLSGKYLGKETLAFLREVRSYRPDARLLLLLPSDVDVLPWLIEDSELASACFLRSVAPTEVPRWIRAADLGLALVRNTFSMKAASAIKVGEYLLCGVPVLATAGVGDNAEVVRPDVGRCLREVTQDSLATAAQWAVNRVFPHRENFRASCRAAGIQNFSLATALDSYETALRAALGARRMT